jgi:hypothetical protein
MSQENVELLRRGIEAWNRRELDVWLDLGTPDVEWMPAGPAAVERTVYRGYDEVRAGRPVLTVPKSKTPSGERVVPLSPETVRRLTRRRANASFGDDASPVFPNRFGKPIDPHNFRQRVFRPAATRAGVEWATPHALRHGLATLMAEHGLMPAEIAAQLGHADGGVLALRTYIHAEITDAPDFIDNSFAKARRGST